MKKNNKIIIPILTILFIIIVAININIEGKDQGQTISGVPTIIDFGSDCYTCTLQKEYLDKLKEKYADEINIIKIDIYDNPKEAEAYGVKVVPTLIFTDEKENQIYRHEGLLTTEELEQRLFDLDLLQTVCQFKELGC